MGLLSGFAGSITMQLTTTVDASPAGGSSTAPLRIRYTFSPTLVAGSGPSGAGDTSASYAPVQKVTIFSAPAAAGACCLGWGLVRQLGQILAA